MSKSKFISRVDNNEWILRTLSFWLNTNINQDFKPLASLEIEYFKKNLDLIYPSHLSLALLRILQSLLKKCSPNLRYQITSTLKLAHKINSKNKKAYNQDFFRRFLSLKAKTGSPGLDWNGHQAAICISHDVDYLDGYDFVHQMAEIDNEFTVQSTFNFLTHWDYKVTQELIQNLLDKKMEVGLHGSTHDIGFGFLDPDTIRKEIDNAVNTISIGLSGFRSPALSLSYELLSILEKKGFLYDSSFRAFDKNTRSLKVCFPFKYPMFNIWELPVTIQDSDLFRDMRLSEKESLETLHPIIEKIINCRGLAVLNFHPCIVKKRVNFYKKFLESIVTLRRQGIWITTMDRIARHLNSALQKEA